LALKAFAGGRLFGERLGTGPPKVLGLHGWGRDHRDLLSVLDGFDAVTVDLPGFGSSPPPPVAWGAVEYAIAIRPLLTEEFEGGAILLGHSFGGRVAVNLAVSNPEIVRVLVLTGVPLIRRKNPRARTSPTFQLLRALYSRGFVSEQRMERARQRYGSKDYREATGVMRNTFVRLVNESYEAELKALTCPVELVWAEGDYVVPLSIAYEAQSLIRNVNLSICSGGDHFSCLLDGGAVRAAIEKYYTRLMGDRHEH
jgi:pimeloyl-ACP methyl ester carboxylesterase